MLLVFTSAGDKTNFFEMWGKTKDKYDIAIAYFGDREDHPYQKYATEGLYIDRKGGKFQNFYWMWKNIPKIKEYDQYLVIDDDIIISDDDIVKLSEIGKEYKLDILQPAFSREGKISHKVTECVPGLKLHYTNFVEVTTPLISKSAMEICMKHYDTRLVGWGIDWLFIWYLGRQRKNAYAIVDCVTCINPKEEIRQIDQLQSRESRILMWNTVKNERKMYEWTISTYGKIKLTS